MRVGDVGECADLIRPIDGPGLGRLGEREHGRADVMRAAPLALHERALQSRRRDPAGGAGKPDQLGAAAEEFRRAAFVDRDVRLVVTQHGAPRGHEMGEGERIGGGPGRHQEHGDLALEERSELLLDAPGPLILPVGERRPAVGAPDGGQDFRGDPRGVVAGEVHEPVPYDGAEHRPRPPADFWAWAAETSHAEHHFPIRRSLVFMIRIWQGKLGQ